MTAVLVYPSGGNGAIRMVETPSSHIQSTLGPMGFHMGNYVMENHIELCDTHVEIRGPKGIRIRIVKWGGPLGGVPTFHGATSPTPIGAFQRGDSLGTTSSPHSSSAASPAG
jgi:hypothetical protein